MHPATISLSKLLLPAPLAAAARPPCVAPTAKTAPTRAPRPAGSLLWLGNLRNARGDPGAFHKRRWSWPSQALLVQWLRGVVQEAPQHCHKYTNERQDISATARINCIATPSGIRWPRLAQRTEHIGHGQHQAGHGQGGSCPCHLSAAHSGHQDISFCTQAPAYPCHISCL